MIKDLIIENDLKQLLIGSLLGDGSFVSVGKYAKNKCLSIAHSIKQKDYLLYKWNILNKYNLVPPIRESKVNNSRYTHELTECRLKTRLHPIFTEIRNLYYDSNNHKRVSLEFVKDIDALISGDLQNQITSSCFSAEYLNVPFLGVYSACASIPHVVKL